MKELLQELYVHTTMTLDDILYIADRNGITTDVSVEGKLIASKENEKITVDVINSNDLIYIFDIE